MDTIKPRTAAVPAAGSRHAPTGLKLELPPAAARQRKSQRLQLALFFTAAVVLVIGIVVFLKESHDHRALARRAAAAGSAPSTTKPGVAAVANYTVPADHPRYLNIPKLDVHARVLSLGTLASGALAAPNNVFDTGWYDESSLPGQPGAMLIDGHVSSWTTKGVFYGLKNLKPGDELQVVRGDGTVFTYQVVKSQVFPADQVDMKAAMTPIVSGRPGLNLITCTGKIKPGTSEFNQRIVVFTKQV